MPEETYTKKIIMFEDDKEMVRVISLYLNRAGYEVISRPDTGELVELIRDIQPDAILMDMMLPDRDGWESIAMIKSEGDLQHIPVIAVTALGSPGHKLKAHELGCSGYLQKPFRQEELIRLLDYITS